MSENEWRYTKLMVMYYASHFGITCPIDLRIKKLNASYGRCGLHSNPKWESKKERYKRPYVYLVLDSHMVSESFKNQNVRKRLHSVIIHELIHGTGNHTHNKNFYETALKFNIETEHGGYKEFASCHR